MDHHGRVLSGTIHGESHDPASEDRIDRVIGHLPDPLMSHIDGCLKSALGLL